MPRQVSATIQAATQQRVTDPWYLVELGFEPPLRFSTHSQLDWDGRTWVPGGVDVESVSTTASRLVLDNADNSISALVLGAVLAEVPVKIYSCYDSNAALLHAGVMESVPPPIGRQVTVTTRGHQGAAMYPTERVSAPVFNHLTPTGTIIRWGDGELVLEAEDY